MLGQQPKFFYEGLGNINYGSPPSPPSSGIPFLGANNGVSISSITAGVVVFGQDVAQAGAPGKLLSDREVPFNGFNVGFSGLGNFGIGLAVPAFLLDISRPAQTLIPFLNYSAGAAETFQLSANNVPGSGASGYSNIFQGVNTGNPGGNAGFNNHVIGNDAFLANTTGSFNVGIGDGVLADNTTGNYNIAIGWDGAALRRNITGNENIALGSDALGLNVSGSSNIAIGTNALKDGTAGNFCIGIGENVMFRNTNVLSLGNTGVGAFIFGFNAPTIGSFNSAYGYRIGTNITGAIGDSNTLLGSFISDLGLGLSIGSNNIVVGANVNQGQSLASNQTIIGNGMTCTLPNFGVLGRSDQNIMIGNTAPGADNGARLQVNGSITTTDPGAGVGKWLLGQIHAAVVTVNLASYLEVNIDGAVVRLAVLN